jgi:hypothetical protein
VQPYEHSNAQVGRRQEESHEGVSRDVSEDRSAGRLQIVDYMSDKERTDMLAINDGRSTFMHKMCELEELAQGYCVFEGIGTVIAQLFGPDPSVSGSGDEDEHSDGREDDEEEEEEEQVNGDAGGHDGIKFANDEQEMIFLECFDSGGAPRMDARSQRILAQYH